MFPTTAFGGIMDLYYGSLYLCVVWVVLSLLWIFTIVCIVLGRVMGVQPTQTLAQQAFWSIESCMQLGDFGMVQLGLFVAPVILLAASTAIYGLKKLKPVLMTPWIFLVSLTAVSALYFGFSSMIEVVAADGFVKIPEGTSTICTIVNDQVLLDANYYRFRVVYALGLLAFALPHIHGYLVMASYQHQAQKNMGDDDDDRDDEEAGKKATGASGGPAPMMKATKLAVITTIRS